MGFTYFENGVSRYIDHYDPLPDNEIRYRNHRPRRSESLPRGWW